MSALFRVLLEIIALRSGPQALPASSLLLGIVAAMHLAVELLVLALIEPGAPRPLLAGAADLALDAALMWAVLAVARRPERFVQSLAALYGAGFLLTIAVLPGGLLVRGGGALAGPGALLGLMVFAWSMVVLAHVLRHALELRPAGAMVIAVSWTLVSVVVGLQLRSA